MTKESSPAQPGTVYLVGSGPGAHDLMTLRAARLIADADVIVYDHLIADDALTLAQPECERICAGKKASNHTLPQGELNLLLVELARAGKRVVRLKGGDPFIFGRGGEEIETLAAHGIPFEIVPGVTAAAGCAAYAGIPLTHRDHAQTVVFATGHLKDDTVDLDWTALARPRQTVVIYMGLGALDIICERLIAHGLPAHTPAAVIHAATTPGQCGVHSTLARLSAAVREAGIRTPALIMIGEVVALDPGLLLRQALTAATA